MKKHNVKEFLGEISSLFLISIIFSFFNLQILNANNLSGVSDKTLCMSAIKGYEPFWDTSSDYTSHLRVAKKRGLTERACARLTQRFSERELRSASNKTERNFQNQTKSKAKPTSKRGDDLQTLIRNLSKSNAQQTVELKNLKRSLKVLSKQINQEKKNKKDVAQQNKKLEDLTQLVSDLQLSIKSKEESNLNIQEGNATIKAINTSLQRIKNENQELQKKNEKLLKTIADWQDVIQRLKRNQESSSKPQNQNTEKSKKTSVLNEPNTPPVQEEDLPDYMIWSIPVLLIIGAFGIILVVLIRRNNKNREELEKSLRNSRRNLSPEKPKSEVSDNTLESDGID